MPTEPLKSLEKKGKTLKKTRNHFQGLVSDQFLSPQFWQWRCIAMHHGRLTRPENSLANFGYQASNKKLRIKALRMNSLAAASGCANEIATILFFLQNFLANGRLWQNPLAIANAMA